MQDTPSLPPLMPLRSTPLPMLLVAATASVAIMAAGLLMIDEAGASREGLAAAPAKATPHRDTHDASCFYCGATSRR